jgi:hypothetical protein
MSDPTDTSQPPAPPATTTPATLYAVSLLLTTPEGHAAAAAIADDAPGALAMALRAADRERPGEALGGSISPIPSDVVALALMRWLVAADAGALQTLAEDLLAALPAEAIRDAWTVLHDAIETTDTMRQSRRRRGRGEGAAPPPDEPAIAA